MSSLYMGFGFIHIGIQDSGSCFNDRVKKLMEVSPCCQILLSIVRGEVLVFT